MQAFQGHQFKSIEDHKEHIIRKAKVKCEKCNGRKGECRHCNGMGFYFKYKTN